MNLREIIIFENEDLVALNKPAGLLSIPDREGKEESLKKILQEKFSQIFTVHRLDKETSGLIVFAKTETAHEHLSRQFENRETIKIYHGLVLGSPSVSKASLDVPIAEHPSKKNLMVVNRKGKPSLTDYELLENFGIYSWLQFQIHTGRTHQIRVHMKHIGHPVACDPLYGDGKAIFLSSIKHRYKISKDQLDEKPILHRLALHSSLLKLTGRDGNEIKLEAPLPKDLRALLNQLRKWKNR